MSNILDEPLFTIRAQDQLAEGVLAAYYEAAQSAGCEPSFLEEIEDIIGEFHTWANENPDRVKIPD